MRIPFCSLAFCACVLLGLTACSDSWSTSDQRFMQTYTDILILRERSPDTTTANPKVRELMQKNGYTEASFQEQFYNRYTQSPDRFRQLIDSARSYAHQVVLKERKSSKP